MLNVGVLMRSFARTEDKVQPTVNRVVDALKEIIFYNGLNWQVSSVLVAVPTDQRFKDRDCGKLASTLRVDWKVYRDADCGARTCPHDKVKIIDIALGDLFVGIQNFAINYFASKDCDIMITLAPSAFRYFDLATAGDMMQAFIKGAKVAAVAVPEDGIDELVNRGTLGGPITAWRLRSIIAVGGFDASAQQSFIDEENPKAGVEEIIPLTHLIKTYGQCVAPIQPSKIVEKRVLEGEDLIRHQKQIETKTTRQLAHAATLGVTGISFFASGVMGEYRI